MRGISKILTGALLGKTNPGIWGLLFELTFTLPKSVSPIHGIKSRGAMWVLSVNIATEKHATRLHATLRRAR